MADQELPTETSRSQLREFRRVVADVVGELRSQEIRDSYAAVTLVELMDRHVVRLVEGSAAKPSRLARIEALYVAYKNSIEGIKATSPSVFRAHDPNSDVNTAP